MRLPPVLEKTQRYISGFLSSTNTNGGGGPDVQDNNCSPASTSHVPLSDGPRASMRRPVHAIKSITKSVPKFLDIYDNVSCDPIAVSSDEEDNTTTSITSTARTTPTTTRMPHSKPGTLRSRPPSTTTVQRAKRRPSELRDEDRLLGQVYAGEFQWGHNLMLNSRRERDPDAVKIQDPMMRNSFLDRSKYRPVNTLDRNPGTRSDYILHKTGRTAGAKQTRDSPPLESSPTSEVRENDHDAPNKRRRTGPSPMSGPSRDRSISLDDSRHFDGSGDEIQPRPQLATGPVRRKSPIRTRPVNIPKGRSSTTRSPPHDGDQSGSGAEKRGQAVSQSKQTASMERELGPTARLSPEVDEAAFTKGSAKRRKGEREGVLGDSSPGPGANMEKTPVRSSYFNPEPQSGVNGDHVQDRAKPIRTRTTKTYPPPQESPDALQTEDLTPTSFLVSKRQPLHEIRARDRASTIIGSPSSVNMTRKAKSSGRTAGRSQRIFDVVDLLHPDLSRTSTYPYTLVIDHLSGSFAFDSKDSNLDEGPIAQFIPITKIIQVRYGENSSKLSLYLSRSSDLPEKICIELDSPKSVFDVIRSLQDCVESITVKAENKDWMDRLFQKQSEVQLSTQSQRSQKWRARSDIRRPGSDSESHVVKASPTEKRLRKIDQLDAPQGGTSDRPTTIPAAEHVNLEERRHRRRSPSRDSVPKSLELAENASSKIDNPAATTATTRPQTRSTRSQASRSREDSNSRQTERHSPQIRFSETGQLGPPWKTALMYPPHGKKRATVEFDDLRRLDDDEFLNDSLVSLFLRYLEHHMERGNNKVWQKMYFFNSYFYDTLTKGANGKKGFNYEAVSKWTRNVDLFSRDFVVVPVNENFHWFVAIICNLPYFKRKPKEEGDTDGHGDGDDNDDDNDEPVDVSGTSLQQPAEETQRSFAELSLSDADNERHTSGDLPPTPVADKPSTSPKKKAGRRKHVRRSLPKYDIDKPVIITLDSLGSARSATCAVLKQYIVQEAKNKRCMDIDAGELRGMTAKEIPTQSNFSDCGLYLCMYLEQFATDPYSFARRILQREENIQRWPRKIHSHELRSRLREMILELHRKQEGAESQDSIPEIGKILIDQEEPAPEMVVESPPSKPKKAQEVREARLNFLGRKNGMPTTTVDSVPPRSSPPPSTPSSPSEATPRTQERPRQEAVVTVNRPDLGNEHDLIVIDDDASQSPNKSRHSNPAELAAQLRHTRETLLERRRPASASAEFFPEIQSSARHTAFPERKAVPGTFEQNGDGGGNSPDDETELVVEVPETPQEEKALDRGVADAGDEDMEMLL